MVHTMEAYPSYTVLVANELIQIHENIKDSVNIALTPIASGITSRANRLI